MAAVFFYLWLLSNFRKLDFVSFGKQLGGFWWFFFWLRMGQWIFAEYAWTVFVRADLEAQVLLSHLVYRKSFLVSLGCCVLISWLEHQFLAREGSVDELCVEILWMVFLAGLCWVSSKSSYWLRCFFCVVANLGLCRADKAGFSTKKSCDQFEIKFVIKRVSTVPTMGFPHSNPEIMESWSKDGLAVHLKVRGAFWIVTHWNAFSHFWAPSIQLALDTQVYFYAWMRLPTLWVTSKIIFPRIARKCCLVAWDGNFHRFDQSGGEHNLDEFKSSLDWADVF